MANSNQANPTVYCVGYVADSEDGMALFTGCSVYFDYDSAVKHVDGEPCLDYVTGTRLNEEDDDWDDDDDDELEPEEDELPDYCNDGGECVGYWIITEGGL